MNRKNMLLDMALILSVALWSPAAILAGEHGGQGQAGGEHGGKVMEGSHGMTEDPMTILKEAAQVLKEEGHADLAKKLEDMTKM